MPRGRRLRDYLMRRDGRNPYGSAGGYVVRNRPSRDRASEDYGYGRDYRGYDMPEYDTRRSDRPYSQQDMERGRRDYEYGGQYDMARMDYGDMRSDMHYGERQGNFRPVEAMGYFQGYYGGGQDYARRDYEYDMRGRYDYAGDYGEKLSKEELEHWNKKMLREVDDRHKQMLTKENIAQKSRNLGIQMENFNEDELLTATIAMYTDYADVLRSYVGDNIDIYVKMGKAFLTDKDADVKGGEKLAVYYDCIVKGEDD